MLSHLCAQESLTTTCSRCKKDISAREHFVEIVERRRLTSKSSKCVGRLCKKCMNVVLPVVAGHIRAPDYITIGLPDERAQAHLPTVFRVIPGTNKYNHMEVEWSSQHHLLITLRGTEDSEDEKVRYTYNTRTRILAAVPGD